MSVSMDSHPRQGVRHFRTATDSTPHTSVSVIVPVYNGGSDLARCLESLLCTTPPPDEIIVVGDADTDGSTELAADLGVRSIRLTTRGGPARARNYGAQMARGTILFFIDADVLVKPDAIAQVVGLLTVDEPGAAAVFGRYDDQPSAPNFLSQYKNLLHHYVHSTASEEASTFWGACGAIRRDTFMSMGGFDEGYAQPCIEDVELGYRLKRAGYRIRLLRTLQVTHLKRWTPSSLLKTDYYQRALPWAALILRDRTFINDLNVSVANRVSVMSVYGLLGVLVGVIAGWRSSVGQLSVALGLTLAMILFALNWGLYSFLERKRGLWFAVRAIPWHWLYFVYSGLAFAVSGLRHVAAGRIASREARERRAHAG